MYAEICSELFDALKSQPVQTTTGSTGITTFIKSELIADGGDKPLVKPPVKFPKSAAAQGLRRGRKFDAEFQSAVKGIKPMSNDATRAIKALRANGIVPVKCQHRIVTSNNLTTLIDCVGIKPNSKNEPISIELKTCQMGTVPYQTYCEMQCRRTPMLRCTPGLPNTERARHCLQAAYGAIGLAEQLKCSVSAVVLVLCTDGVVLYSVPKTYHVGTLFVRLVPHYKRPGRVAGAVKVSKPECKFRPWTTTAGKIAKKHGMLLGRIRVKRNVMVVVKGNHALGVLVLVPDWHAAPEPTKIASILKLQAVCKRPFSGYIKMPRLSILVITERTHSKQLHVIMASRPFSWQ